MQGMAERARDMIDAHAHVWDRTCRFVPGARYHPAYEATIATYLRLLDAHGIARAVLVQPSFLGTDNGYLLACLRAHPDRLRGIVVLDPGAGDAELDDLTAAGVIGLRYNLLSLDKACLTAPDHRALTGRARARDWWVEVQADGPDWPLVLDTLGDVRLMVDHLARPSGPDCPGLAAVLARAPEDTCVKLSAPYRLPTDPLPAARRMLDRFGPGRCLWGSDWPHTQHEDRASFAAMRAWLDTIAGPADRARLGGGGTLLGFEPEGRH